MKKLPKSHREAIAVGSAIYLTGRPCKRGHYSPRYSMSGDCIECGRTRARERMRKLRDELRQRMKEGQ